MNRPPLLMRMRFRNGNRKFGLWLPFFIIMPLLLVLLIVLSPLLLIAVLVLWPSGWGKLLLHSLAVCFKSFCALRGLEVNVQNADECVYISVT